MNDAVKDGFTAQRRKLEFLNCDENGWATPDEKGTVKAWQFRPGKGNYRLKPMKNRLGGSGEISVILSVFHLLHPLIHEFDDVFHVLHRAHFDGGVHIS